MALPSGATATVAGAVVKIKGPKGELSYACCPEVTVAVDGSAVNVTRKTDDKRSRALHGLTRQLIANMAEGVTKGFAKQLEIIGVGYKAQVKGKTLNLALGFSHPVDLPIPEGLTVTQDEKNKNLLTISGIDKQLVGQFSANVRSLRPPEPYKGKGIRYTTEFVRRKPGKAAAKSAAA